MNNKMEYRAKLGELLFRPDQVASLAAKCKSVLKEYPTNGCAITVSKVLQHCGIGVPDILWAEDLAHHLLLPAIGRRQTTPVFGDVFVCRDLNGNGAADHIGIYLGPAGTNAFMALDNRTIGGLEAGAKILGSFGNSIPMYVRNLKEGSRTPVEYFISII